MVVAGQKERDFDEEYDPSLYELECYLYAVTSYRDFRRYGLPRSGGNMDQPYMWKLALDCIHDAMSHAESEAQAISEDF